MQVRRHSLSPLLSTNAYKAQGGIHQQGHLLYIVLCGYPLVAGGIARAGLSASADVRLGRGGRMPSAEPPAPGLRYLPWVSDRGDEAPGDRAGPEAVLLVFVIAVHVELPRLKGKIMRPGVSEEELLHGGGHTLLEIMLLRPCSDRARRRWGSGLLNGDPDRV